MLINTRHSRLLLLLSFLLIGFQSFSQGSNCGNSDPFCTGTTYNFPNSTTTPDLGTIDCCSTTPNPAWYFMELDASGNMTIHIEQTDAGGSGLDVDFVLFGPYPSLAVACASIPSGPIEDCSYSAAAVEDADIVGGVTGEVYVLLLTNYSGDPGFIEFSQTSGSASADCSLLCGVNSFTAVPGSCDPITNTYTLNGALDISNPPSSGTCTISNSCGGSQVFNAPFPSIMNYSFPGLAAAGASCTVTVTFSADATCNTSTTYTAPAGCSCSITAVTATPTACNTATTTFDLSGTVTVTNPPASGTLTITNSCGGSQVINPPFVSPINYSIPSVPGGSSTTCTVTAQFSADPSCSLTQNYTSPNCCGLTLNTTFNPTLCSNNCTGDATVTYANNLSSSITYQWQFLSGAPIGQTTPTAINLCAQTYIVAVSDSTICTVTDTVTVTALSDPSIDALAPVSTSCFGVCDAALTITATNATQYSIDNGGTYQASNSFTLLCPGVYELMVTNANGCTDDSTITIVEPSQLVANIAAIHNVSCAGLLDGGIDISVSGGTTPYNFAWSNGQTSQNLIDVGVGNYTVNITDANGCTATTGGTITEPIALNVTASATDATCYGVCDGTLSSNVTGGTGPFTYVWTGATVYTTANITNACADTYQLTVTDANGCTFTVPGIVVNQPPQLTIDYVLIDNERCYADCQGSIEIHATGTAGYSIDGGITFSTNPLYDSLCAGNYVVAITDITGCIVTQDVSVLRPPRVDAQFAMTPNPTDLFNTTIQFSNLSVHATQYVWEFDNLGFSTLTNPSFEFPVYVVDTYLVCLTVVNDSLCSDSICHEVIITDYTYIYVPNTFTPNGDGINDVFMPVVYEIDPETYTFYVFDRWGEIVFQSSDMTQGWDGTFKALKCKSDVYVWKVVGKSTINAEKKDWVGHVNLMR